MPRPASIALVATASGLAGAIGSGLLGGALTSLVWVAQTPDTAQRGIAWGMLHGLLIGAVGLVSGVMSALVATSQAARLTSRHAAMVGAGIGVFFGIGLGALVWTEASSRPVAIAAVVSQAIVGALIAGVARSRAI